MAVADLPKVETLVGMDRVALGRRIRELRVAAGLSQKALAEAAGVPQSQVSQWESGNSSPLATTVPAICDALGCSPDEIFTEALAPPPPPKRGRPRKKGED